jgi:hypothetical protein
MRYDLPEGYSSIVCGIARSSLTKEVIVVDSNAKHGAKVSVSLLREIALPGSQVAAVLPSGHTALVTVPEQTKILGKVVTEGNDFVVNFPSAPSAESVRLIDVTVEKDWSAGSRLIQTTGADGEAVEVKIHIPAGVTEGDKVKCVLPLNSTATATIHPRAEPVLKLKAKELKHPVGTKFHVLCEMATAQGDWLQIASESPSSDDAAEEVVGDLFTPGGLNDTAGKPATGPDGEVLGWVLVHCDKHEHEETNLQRLVEPERQLVVNQLHTGETLDIRQAASTASTILQTVSPGAVLEMVDSVAHQEGAAVRGVDDGVWLRVRSNEQIGWVRVMHPCDPVDTAETGFFHRKSKAVADDYLTGVYRWTCLPQSTTAIESLERAAPPQYVEVDVPQTFPDGASGKSTPAEPGSLIEVLRSPLTGRTMNVVVPAKALWRKKNESGQAGGFSFVTKVIVPESSETPSRTTIPEHSDVSKEPSSVADVVAPEELQKTLRAGDSKENCVITAADDGIGTKATAVGGPATVFGCVRGGRGRWYFEVCVTSGEGSVGICSTQFQNRKKTRAPHRFEKLGHAGLLGRQDAALTKRQTAGGSSRRKGKSHEKDEVLKLSQEKEFLKHAKVHKQETNLNKWEAKEMAYVQPTFDVNSVQRTGRNATPWQEGEMFRTAVDHETYEVAIPPKYDGGMVGFEVTNRYCALGEDPNSLNCAYKFVQGSGSSRHSHGVSSGFSTLLPNITLQSQSEQDTEAPQLVEGKTVPAGLARRTGNAAEGILRNLCGWKMNDVVGVCVDTTQLAVHYTLNGVAVGSVSYDGFDSYDSFYPAASIAAGDDMTFVFRKCDMAHAPPLSACQYFKVGQEAIDEELKHELEPWEISTVTLPLEAEPGQDGEDGGVLKRVPVKTDDGRLIMAVVPEGSKPGDAIEVKVPAAQLIGHFQVLVPAIVRTGVGVTSPKVSGAAGRLSLGSVISIFDMRTIKSQDPAGETTIKRARTTAGWFSLVVDGQDVVVEAEAEDQAAAADFAKITSLHDVEKSHTEKQRQEALKQTTEKHLGEQGIARAQTAAAVSIAFTASAIEFHSRHRGDGDAQASIAEIHRTAQISTIVTRADDQPELSRLQPATAHDVDAEDAPADGAALVDGVTGGGTAVIFSNPLSDLNSSMVGSISDADIFDEPVPERGHEAAEPVDVAPTSHANAVLHLDSSQHHDAFDEFISSTTCAPVGDV